jgi:hypothetical protein
MWPLDVDGGTNADTSPILGAQVKLQASIFLLLGAVACVAPLTGCRARVHTVDAGGWEVLGERTVNGGYDHDAIDVGRADGRFSRVVLEVEGSSLELFDVTITFGDGQKFSPATRLVFDEGTRSRVIDLPGGARVIRRIDFRYGNLPGGGRAHMIVKGS